MSSGDASRAVVVLLSGGLDSAVMVGMAVDAGDHVHPLHVRQGFLWEEEEGAAIVRYLAALEAERAARGASGAIHPLQTVALGAPGSFASRWALDPSEPVPGADTPDEAVFLPGRNLALLTQGAILAHSVGASRVQLGVLRHNPFPDATAEFFAAFEAVAGLALAREIRVERPLGGMEKREVLARGAGRYPLRHSLSCIRPFEGTHCGRCNKCEERRRAYADLGLEDPAPTRGAG